MGADRKVLTVTDFVANAVKRWDIYDIADELADLPYFVAKGIDDPRELPEVIEVLHDLEQRLWAASRRGGQVGPAPHYYQKEV